MNKRFDLKEVSSALGVAPSTAERISGLLNGTINPDSFRSVEAGDPLSQFGVPLQVEKIFNCLAILLEGKVNKIIGPNTLPDTLFIDRDDLEVPTILYSNEKFIIESPAEFVKTNFKEAAEV